VRPVLVSFSFGGATISLPSYGFAIALGIAAGLVVTGRATRRTGLPRDRVMDLAFWGLGAGLVGARLLYVLLDAGAFARLCADGTGAARTLGAALRDCAAPLRIWDGGLVFYGGALGAAAFAAVFARRQGWRLAAVGDTFAPGLALGHALGRLGCLAAGCCYGKVCAGGGAACLVFSRGSVAHGELAARRLLAPGADGTPPLHATQLYEAAGELLIFGLLVLVGRRERRPGAVALAYCGAYAALRFALELFRGDAARRFVAELPLPGVARALGLPPGEPLLLSTSQAVSLLLLALVAGALVRRRLRAA
jgi:phosphatidylglycerol:prolipoprotein diacylglycerol transferase